MADFRDHVYQRVFFAVLSTWTKYNILGVYPWYIGGARRSTAMWLRERWHRSPFPMFSRLGEVMRDVQETSSEIHLKKMTWNSDIFLCQLKHLGTSWKIFVYHVVFFHVCSTFIAVVAGSHGAQPWDSREYVGQTLLQAGPGRFWSWYFGIFGMLPYVAMRWPD